MTLYHQREGVTLYHADALDLLAALPAASVDAVVTDPPYGIGFMGHAWDQFGTYGALSAKHGGANVSFGGPPHPAMEAGRYDRSATANQRFQAWCEAWGRELIRVMKPGAHALVFGGPRTYHRLTAGLEDAGLEVRDCLMWIMASGFPKSLNLGDGRGTALKPGYEPIVLARAPLDGTIAATVAKHGTGALNIDACRIGTADDRSRARGTFPHSDDAWGNGHLAETESHPAGRWPSNLVLSHVSPGPDGTGGCEPRGVRRVKSHNPDNKTLTGQDTTPNTYQGGYRVRSTVGHADADGMETVEVFDCVEHCPVAELDRQSGDRRSSGIYQNVGQGTGGGVTYMPVKPTGAMYADTGGASRYFQVFSGRIDEEYVDSLSEVCQCDASVKPAESRLVQSPTMFDAALGDSVPGHADELPNGSKGRLTPGATSTRRTGDGIASGANPESGLSDSNLNTDGSGSKRTDRSRQGMKSTTSTTTRPPTICQTCGFLVLSNTTTTTTASERTTESVTGERNVYVSDAASIDRLTNSSSDEREPTKDTAIPAHSNISESGELNGPRFLFVAKPSRAERDQYLDDLPRTSAAEVVNRTPDSAGMDSPRAGAGRTSGARNSHPTVKPIQLLRYLTRLVAPPGGTILDPFCGSATTGVAALLEGFKFIGVDREEAYLDIGMRRMARQAMPLWAGGDV